MNVELVSTSPNPLESLYLAYRVCYSKLKPEKILDDIRIEKISKEEMASFVNARLQTGHDSPLRQITFEFILSGLSRALTHQLVRHNVGWNFEQQSQRYVSYKAGVYPYVVPPSIIKSDIHDQFVEIADLLGQFYANMVEEGIPEEDARFILPNAAASNIKLTVSLPALQHFCDVRLCTRAQWEIRALAQKMRVAATGEIPWLSPFFGIKCEASRMGYCDEDIKEYKKCPLSKIRKHKSQAVA